MAADPRFAVWAAGLEDHLDRVLPPADAAPQRLHAAMRHAVLGGGKRMRALLVYASGTLLQADEATLHAPASAVELIHAYSLVHDDLPAMDDDDLRRGKPTVHIAFDEATAILAGDALQTRAFEHLAASDAPAALRVDWLATLAQASGAAGMCGGQALDIDATGTQQTLDALQHMHALKTGALIRAAVRMGARAGGADAGTLTRLDDFATALGLAFQVRDDILDIEASSEQLGKTAGKDVAQAKSTYPALLGIDGAKAKLAELDTRMREALAPYDSGADALRALGDLAIHRSH
ncbi:farnesyl diphosphate synthase [Pseudoxanthomonas japonensis]|uniref:polyprenyl synthetase family protein n=1 Tax=Pseudoxanthomonas TaxID=83618 RepID=UPI000780F2D4|nr:MULTISPECIES: farnesyl diphosphate synthase [Pseudoxanthomonas]MBA3929222.1 geranyl transferase [Xanthomonas sp.]MBL8257961.1 polyprenyl synthetase family protein [Pseudoxanthomonas mexicana]MDR7067592.1 farnesyl diphosphate synthase [Pseudoxanthomonas japonensis]